MKQRHKAKLMIISLILSLGAMAAPAATVEAVNWGSIIGSVVGGAAVYKQTDAYMKHVDGTEEGRREYFAKLKQEYGVSDDVYHINLLGGIISRLTDGIGASDSSIYNKPFLYFLNPDTSFNAFCGLGHVMGINQGIFSLSENIDEVAVVLAHEMGHGMKNHVYNGTKKKLNTMIAASVAAGAMGDTALANMAMNALVGQVNNVQITKKQEWEADNLAFDYTYAAGYNPGAGAALWQRIFEREGDYKHNLVGEIFSPNDHPSHEERRDNYEKKLEKLSGGAVTIKKKNNTVQVNGKDFVTPAPAGDMSSAERKYFIQGNLAAAYAHGQHKSQAYVSGNTVMLGNQAIMTCVDGDPSPSALAALLNKIK